MRETTWKAVGTYMVTLGLSGLVVVLIFVAFFDIAR
jgi:hypothetical protein